MSILTIAMCVIGCFIFIMICQYKRVSYLSYLIENLKEKKQFTNRLQELHQKQVFWSYVAIFPLMIYFIVCVRLFDFVGMIPPLLCYVLGMGIGRVLAKIGFSWIKPAV